MMNTITRDFGYTFFSKKKCFLYVSVMHRWHLLDISARKSSIFFSRVILKWLWMFIVFCGTPKQTIGSTGKHRVKIGWRSEFYCHCCYLLTHSLNSTTAVASPPIGGSSHKKRKKKAMTLKTTKLRLLNVIIFHPIVKFVNRASLCAIMPKWASIVTVDRESWVRELISGTN